MPVHPASKRFLTKPPAAAWPSRYGRRSYALATGDLAVEVGQVLEVGGAKALAENSRRGTLPYCSPRADGAQARGTSR